MKAARQKGQRACRCREIQARFACGSFGTMDESSGGDVRTQASVSGRSPAAKRVDRREGIARRSRMSQDLQTSATTQSPESSMAGVWQWAREEPTPVGVRRRELQLSANR